MPAAEEVAEAIAAAENWDTRISLIRQVPEKFGTAHHAKVYAAIASRVYVPSLQAEFAYVHWREEYLPQGLESAYALADEGTRRFQDVEQADLVRVIQTHPETLRVFRLILGFLRREFAEAGALVANRTDLPKVSENRIKRIESGGKISAECAQTCATVIDLVMKGELFPPKPAERAIRRKLDKPDTAEGWASVRRYAATGVPLPLFLHQREYGGAFRQLLDATSSQRGNLLEDPVDALFSEAGVPFLRTGSHNQAEIEARFGLTVKPAPDFVVFDQDRLRAILECKAASDGGTARDKAARFRALRAEANRLGGVPLFAVLGGTGWRRTKDALGPVVRDTDGRVFTITTLSEMLETEPFPTLRRPAPQ